MARLVLAAPPLLLVLAGLTLLVEAPLAWGAATAAGLASWVTSFSALLVALPALGLGGLALREVLRRTRVRFSVLPVLAVVGYVCLLWAAGGVLAFAAVVGDASTYATLRSTGPGDPGTSAIALLMITFFGTGIFTLAAAGVTYLYCQSIFEDAVSRFDRRPDEVDVVEALMHGSRPAGWRRRR